MINDDSLKTALTTLERHAPAEDEILAGLRTGIARRRRRIQLGSVAAVAGLAAAVAIGVVYVAPGRGADQTGIVGPAATPPPPKTATPPPPPSLPFSVGATPEGYQLETWEAGTTTGHAQYAGTKDFQVVVVTITSKRKESMAGDVEEPVTIAGRPGVVRRLTPDRMETQLIWQLADGRWAFVGGRAPTVTLQMLQRVADSLTPTPTPLPAPFSLSTLPDGYHAAFWIGGTGGGPVGSLTMCRTPIEWRDGQLPKDCLHVGVGQGAAPTNVEVKLTNEPGLGNVPIDQQQTVNGLLTSATADGKTVVTQLDPTHYAQAYSEAGGVDALRQLVTLVRP